MSENESAPRWASIKEACRRGPVRKTKLYELIRERRVRAKRLDGKTLVDLNTIDQLIEASPDVGGA